MNKMTFAINKNVGSVDIYIPDGQRTYVLSDGAIDSEITKLFGCLSCSGNGSRIFLGGNVDLSRLKLNIRGQRNAVIFGSNVSLKGNIDVIGGDLTVFIGASTTFQNVNIYCRGWRLGVYIGRDCMFSSEIELRTSDSHSVIDLNDRAVINPPDGIHIGDHVWLTKQVTIQKGAVIGSDNIVAGGSLVSGQFPVSNSVIKGRPARADSERRVTWSRQSEYAEVDEQIFAWRELPLL